MTCPALMSDGRLFTDYRPRCGAISGMLDKNMSSYDYRQYMITNAEQLMQESRGQAISRSSCETCDVGSVEKRCKMSEEQITTCTSQNCTIGTVDVNGLGRGRNYQDSKFQSVDSIDSIAEENHIHDITAAPTKSYHLMSAALGYEPRHQQFDSFYPITGYVTKQ